METEAKIRRLRHVKGYTFKQIAQKLNVTRNTIRRVLSGNTVGLGYHRQFTPSPKLDAFKSVLNGHLEADHKLGRKQRRTAKKHFEELVALGYEGAYDSVQRYVKAWQIAHYENIDAYIPLMFSPGEAYQFDWSTEHVEIDGLTVTLKVGHFRLCYSRKFFVVAYLRESQEMLFEAHDKAFEFFDGLTMRGIYDNMKTAVTLIFAGKKRGYNNRFLKLMDHYLIEPTACTPASGWEKGQVENQVNTIRNWLFNPKLKFSSLEALNEYLAVRCQTLAETKLHPEQKGNSIESIFLTEKAALRQLTMGKYGGYHEEQRKVNSTCLVNYDSNCYSVDCAFAHQSVSVRAYPNRIAIFTAGKCIGEHERDFGRHKTHFNPLHYIPLLQRKPGALRNGAPFQEWKLPAPITIVQNRLLSHLGGDKDFAIILLSLQHYSLEDITFACEMAIEESSVNKDYILNILSRASSTPQPEPIIISDALMLKEDPIANCERYDSLLGEKNDRA